MLSIIIVNYRSWNKLFQCLDSLNTPSEKAFEVIVVDNQSHDGQLSEFQTGFPAVTFIENDGNWGFANGCNRGAANATAETLLFLNPDTIASPKPLKQLLKAKEGTENIGLLSCKQIDAQGKNQKAFGLFPSFWTRWGLTRAIVQHMFPERYPSAKREHKALLDCDWISGSVVMISRTDFDRLGGWDDRFWMYSEDADLCKRAGDLGMRVCYEPNVTITHLHGGASRSNKATKALTKAEVIISKHVFIDKHGQSKLQKKGQHTGVIVSRVLPVLLAAFFTWPLKLAGKPSTDSLKWQHLWDYYQHWLRTGCVYSPRSKRSV